MIDKWAGLAYLESGIPIEDWAAFISIAEGKDRWIFRGQGVASHTLESSLERRCNQLGLSHVEDVETTLLREFMRRFHHYSSYNPQNEIEWLSLMRHHGAPTRFLDWTYSLYVAAYFALERCEKDNNGAVWAIDLAWLHNKCREHIKFQEHQIEGKRFDGIMSEKPGDFTEVFGKDETPWVAPVNAFRLNERVSIQLGIFLAPCDLSSAFMKNFAALNPMPDHVQKYIIPYRLRKEFLKRLYYMNISRTTLFPGLDGFAESLGVFSPLVMNAGLGKSTDLMTYRGRTFLPSSQEKQENNTGAQKGND